MDVLDVVPTPNAQLLERGKAISAPPVTRARPKLPVFFGPDAGPPATLSLRIVPRPPPSGGHFDETSSGIPESVPVVGFYGGPSTALCFGDPVDVANAIANAISAPHPSWNMRAAVTCKVRKLTIKAVVFVDFLALEVKIRVSRLQLAPDCPRPQGTVPTVAVEVCKYSGDSVNFVNVWRNVLGVIRATSTSTPPEETMRSSRKGEDAVAGPCRGDVYVVGGTVLSSRERGRQATDCGYSVACSKVVKWGLRGADAMVRGGLEEEELECAFDRLSDVSDFDSPQIMDSQMDAFEEELNEELGQMDEESTTEQKHSLSGETPRAPHPIFYLAHSADPREVQEAAAIFAKFSKTPRLRHIVANPQGLAVLRQFLQSALVSVVYPAVCAIANLTAEYSRLLLEGQLPDFLLEFISRHTELGAYQNMRVPTKQSEKSAHFGCDVSGPCPPLVLKELARALYGICSSSYVSQAEANRLNRHLSSLVSQAYGSDVACPFPTYPLPQTSDSEVVASRETSETPV